MNVEIGAYQFPEQVSFKGWVNFEKWKNSVYQEV